MASLPRRLYRSRTDRMLCGVAGGLAEYFDVDPVVVRLLFAISAFFGGVGIPIYLLLYLVIPVEGEEAPFGRRARTVTADRSAGETSETEAEPLDWDEPAPHGNGERVRHRRQMGAALVLIFLGLMFLGGNLGLFRWLEWRFLWPLVLIGGGLVLLLRRSSRL